MSGRALHACGFALSLAFMLMAAGPSSAQSSLHHVYGQVLKASDQSPISNARVRLIRSTPEGEVIDDSTTSNSAGHFSFALPPGWPTTLSPAHTGIVRVLHPLYDVQNRASPCFIGPGPDCLIEEGDVYLVFHLRQFVKGTVSFRDEAGAPITTPMTYQLFLGPWPSTPPESGTGLETFGPDLDYQFDVTGLTPGTQFLRAHAEGFKFETPCSQTNVCDTPSPGFNIDVMPPVMPVHWIARRQPDIVLSGRVTVGVPSVPIAGATILGLPASLNPGGVVSGSDGMFTAVVPYAWSGTLSASAPCKTLGIAVTYGTLTQPPPLETIQLVHKFTNVIGHVSTPEGNPVAGVDFFIPPALHTSSQSNGDVSVQAPCGMTTTITASKEGYRLQPISTSVTFGEVDQPGFVWTATPCPQTLYFITPAAGTSFAVGQQMQIRAWTLCATGFNEFTFKLWRFGPGGPSETLGTSSDGRLTWQVTLPASTTCRLTVEARDTGFVEPTTTVQSEEFTIASEGFEDVTPDYPVSFRSASGEGAAWLDFHSDGGLDVITATDPIHVHFKGNDPLFTEATDAVGLSQGGNVRGVALADYDNDGKVDLFTTRAGGSSVLFHGYGGSPYLQWSTGQVVTQATGDSAESAAWGDYDGDGRVDLYVTYRNRANRLFHNTGNATTPLAEVLASPVLINAGSSSAVWGDYDGDGKLDLFVCTRGQPDALFRNTGSGNFELATGAGILAQNGSSNAAVFGDYDNDGLLDLFVCDGAADGQNVLYRNTGSGFQRVLTNAPSGAANEVAASAAWGDYNGDRFLDLYVTNRSGNGSAVTNTLYANVPVEGGRGFAAVTSFDAFELPGQGGGAAWGDYDFDGDPDLLVVRPSSANPEIGDTRLFKNVQGTPAGWLKVRLVTYGDNASNRAAIGARVQVQTSLGTQTRIVSGGGGRYSQNELLPSFATGTAVSQVKVYWPSGRISTLTTGFPSSGQITVNEPAPPSTCPPNCPPPPPCRGCPQYEGAAAAVTELLGSTPNPAGHQTRIRFALAQKDAVQIEIFDAMGRRVRAASFPEMGPGAYAWTWDTRDESGQRVGSGAYYVRMKAGEVIARARLVIVH